MIGAISFDVSFSCLRCKIFVIQFPCKSFFLFFFLINSAARTGIRTWDVARSSPKSSLLDYFSYFSFFNCFVFISVENGARATRPLGQWESATGLSHLGMGWTGKAPLGAFNRVDDRGEAAGKMGRSYIKSGDIEALPIWLCGKLSSSSLLHLFHTSDSLCFF